MEPTASSEATAGRPHSHDTSLPIGEQPGDDVGPYRLLSVIGEGGFGVVYLAERREPIVQRVALKVIKPGMDSRAVIARFEQERQALAVMNHPSVAKVFDAGTTRLGRPYFVMELVQGEPITNYCDRHAMTIRKRLELFIATCEAVQHAHHKGVIHRDLKPSNILVAVHEGRAVPKVIDFGVAKAVSQTLTQATILTERGILIGTPEYMSPEQAEMGALDIDTRTDVYALGVVLYELVSGLLPFDSQRLRAAGFEAICKIIREQEAPRPSTRLSEAAVVTSSDVAAKRHTQREQLARELREELDWIPLKAIRKDRTHRYDTPLDLAQDIARYLRGEALEAGPESRAYRLKKLVHRNRGSFTAVGAVLLALGLGLIGTMWMAAEARREATTARIAAQVQERLRLEADRRTNEVAVAKRNAELEAYCANLIAADASLALDEPGRVRARLDACPVPLRNWEWRWLNAQADRSLTTLAAWLDPMTAAEHSIVTVQCSPDGTRVVTASIDGSARVWDIASAKVVCELRGHHKSVSYAAFSRDGQRTVTASEDKTARIWNAITGEPALVLSHTQPVRHAAFSVDAARVLTKCANGSVGVWDAETGQQVALISTSPAALFLDLLPDGQRVLVECANHSLETRDVVTGHVLSVMPGHRDRLRDVAICTDGTRLVTTSRDGSARVWDAASGAFVAAIGESDGAIQWACLNSDGGRLLTMGGKGACVWEVGSSRLIATLVQKDALGCAVFSKDGRQVIGSRANAAVCVWDSGTGAVLTAQRGHTDWVQSLALSPDGSQVITSSRDATVRVWAAMPPSERIVLRGHSNSVTHAAFSPDSTRVLTTAFDGTARVWDAGGGTALAELRGHEPSMSGAAFSPDGMRVLMTSGPTARICSAADGETLAELKGHRGKILDARFARTASQVVTASEDSTARVWDLEARTTTTEFTGHTAPVHSIDVSADGSRVVTASSDGWARVWRRETGEEVAGLHHESAVLNAAFDSRGERILTRTADHVVRIWDANTGAHSLEIRVEGVDVNFACFSPDGSRIVTGSTWDKASRVWNSTTGQLVALLRGHTEFIRSVSFSPDGSRIVTGGADETARVWDTETGKEVAILRGHGHIVLDAQFSPDGLRIVSASGDGTAHVWDSVPYRDRVSDTKSKSSSR